MSLPLDHSGMAVLGVDECLGRLRSSRVGRLAFMERGEPMILPVNHGMDGTSVILRTAPGSKLLAAEDELPVAFEVDGFDSDRRAGWSVVVRGVAGTVDDPAEVARLNHIEVWPWADMIERNRWVRIRGTSITGRVIVHPDRQPATGVGETGAGATTTQSSITDNAEATSAHDSAAMQVVRQHHAKLAGTLAVQVEALLTTAAAGGGPFEDARRRALRFLSGELAPHAAAEEAALYPEAASTKATRLLIEGMLTDHKVILRLVDRFTTAEDPVRAAATAYALQVLFEAHLAKENDLLLPVIATNPSVSHAEILTDMHELLGPDCGESDSGAPELDVRAIPHAIRHATVFGAYDAIPPGGSLRLIAPHDPQPLLQQLAGRADGHLDISYLERGPESWRLQLTRV